MLLDAIVLAGGRSARLSGIPKALFRVRGTTLVALAVRAAADAGARRIVLVGDPALEGEARAALADGSAKDRAAQGELAGVDGAQLRLTREDPPFAGPAAAIAAGVAELARDDTSAATPRARTPTEEPDGVGPGSAGPDDAEPGGARAGSAVSDGAGAGSPVPRVLVLACDVAAVAVAAAEVVAAARARREAAAHVAVDDDGRWQPLLGVYRLDALTAAIEEASARAGSLDGVSVRALLGPLAEGTVLVRVAPDATRDLDTWADARGLGASAPESGERRSVGASRPAHPEPEHPSTTSCGHSIAHRHDRHEGAAAMATENENDDQAKELAAWSALLADELHLEGFTADVDALLGIAGVAAHSVRRPAAPLTTYVIGFAAGAAAARGEDPAVAVASALASARALAAAHQAERAASDDVPPMAATDRP